MADSELPSYTTRAPQAAQWSEHTYFLENKNKKWLILHVNRSRSSNPASPPLFIENDPIKGRVEIDLDKAESVKAVTIAVG